VQEKEVRKSPGHFVTREEGFSAGDAGKMAVKTGGFTGGKSAKRSSSGSSRAKQRAKGPYLTNRG